VCCRQADNKGVTGSKFSLSASLTDSQLARLVIQVKNTIGITTDELAGRIGRPGAVVAAWEFAEARPTDADVAALAAQCGVTGEALVLRVQAFSIDRAMGILHVGGSTAYVDPQQGNEHVLATYMSLVRNMRMIPDDGPVELRSHDLDVLADYLDLHDVALVEQLAQAARVTTRRHTSYIACSCAAPSWLGRRPAGRRFGHLRRGRPRP
jgi:hypothetical protein